MKIDFESLNDAELIGSYSGLMQELKKRGIIHSRNLVGDLGEYLAIDYYKRTPGLPKLQPAPQGTQNVDALSRNGDRYSIKATTGRITGVFYGLPPKGSDATPDKKFEFVIIVMLDENYDLKRINEMTWDQFLTFKRWHSRIAAWNLSLNEDLLNSTKTIANRQ